MERTGSFSQQFSTYFHAACLAAHANQKQTGFRQKDLKFFIELLLDWMETTYQSRPPVIKNTQIQRFLNQLVDDGLVKTKEVQSRPHYHFTPHGLLEITTRLVDLNRLQEDQDFYFLYHFVSLYSSKMSEILFEQENLPPSLKLEVKHLLNPNSLLENRIEDLKFKIKKLELRMSEAKKMSALGNKLFEQGKKLPEIVQQMEKKYPYQLNNQKTMTALFKELSPDIQFIEITDAPSIRTETLWEPLLTYYQGSLKQAKSLLATL
jgi:hypothetical protein